MTVLYVVSDDEGAGKTAFCVTLAKKIKQRGWKASIFKPLVRQGVDSVSDPDIQIYRSLVGQRNKGWPIKLSGRGLTREILSEIVDSLKDVSDGADLVLAEGSCNLSHNQSRRVADTLDAKVLVMVRYGKMLSISQMKQWKKALGDRLVGFIINGQTRFMGTNTTYELLPSMTSARLEYLGVIPEDRRLLGVSVAQVAEHLGGELMICEERSEDLVEHVMVGGFGMDPGEVHFSVYDNKAVIVRGDRPDVQMAALKTSTSCMVLTNGIRPIEYVKYEAEQENVPLIVVETDTISTMDMLGEFIDIAQFDHHKKLERYGDLLEQHVDLTSLLSRLGLE